VDLFMFVPYEWPYCGGAIGILSDTFENAVNFIVKKDRERCVKAKALGHVAMRSYKREYFAKSADNFKKDHWNQWLLISIFNVPKEKKTKIAFDNWNYG